MAEFETVGEGEGVKVDFPEGEVVLVDVEDDVIDTECETVTVSVAEIELVREVETELVAEFETVPVRDELVEPDTLTDPDPVRVVDIEPLFELVEVALIDVDVVIVGLIVLFEVEVADPEKLSLAVLVLDLLFDPDEEIEREAVGL
jgi:hypothetical protein